ncbi:hypothetical protein BDV11DRAFT_194726 [Aspergillus similis]
MDDPRYRSPLQWSTRRKFVTTVITCGVTVMAAYAAGESAPAFDHLHQEWGVKRVPYNLSTTVFTLGFAITPMILAPFGGLGAKTGVFG